MAKIAICGKMASGKTTLAEYLVNEYHDTEKFSLANAVKRFARFVYDIPEGHKDRVAFQKIGDGARKVLYENIWIDTLLKEVKIHESINKLENGNEGFVKNFIIDDVRYVNEVLELKDDGWIIVKLEIDEDLQKKRLIDTYPKDWEIHFNARNHPSETEIDLITEDMVDLVITSSNGNNIEEIIDTFLLPKINSDNYTQVLNMNPCL